MSSFRILGPVEASVDDASLPLGGGRQLKLLAFLLLRANRAVSTDVLIDELWGPVRGSTDNRLTMAIARLRKALEPLGEGGESRLRTVSGGYMLRSSRGSWMPRCSQGWWRMGSVRWMPRIPRERRSC